MMLADFDHFLKWLTTPGSMALVAFVALLLYLGRKDFLRLWPWGKEQPNVPKPEPVTQPGIDPSRSLVRQLKDEGAAEEAMERRLKKLENDNEKWGKERGAYNRRLRALEHLVFPDRK